MSEIDVHITGKITKRGAGYGVYFPNGELECVAEPYVLNTIDLTEDLLAIYGIYRCLEELEQQYSNQYTVTIFVLDSVMEIVRDILSKTIATPWPYVDRKIRRNKNKLVLNKLNTIREPKKLATLGINKFYHITRKIRR